MAKRTARTTAILGACGEHYVAAYLSRSRLIVALPRAGVPGCDLLVAGENDGPPIRVQVKTGTDSRRNTKQEGPIYLWYTSFSAKSDKHLWYAYVWLKSWPNGEEQPEVFFVPSHVVAKTMKQCEQDGDAAFFWMKVEDAEKYKGSTGLKAVLEALEQPPVSVK